MWHYKHLPYTGAIVYNNFTVNTQLPIVLDDLGCNGNETNLLECLPQHNCKATEMAGVRCLLKGKKKIKSWILAIIISYR